MKLLRFACYFFGSFALVASAQDKPAGFFTAMGYSPGGAFVTMARPVTENNSVFSVVDFNSTRSLRGGFARTIAAVNGCKLSALADAGVANQATDTGAAFSGGGAVTCQLSQISQRLNGWQALFAVRGLHQSGTGISPQWGFGIGRSW